MRNHLKKKQKWVRAVHQSAIGLVLSAGMGLAYAFDPFVVKDIRVEGLQRTELGAVFSYLPVKIGDTLNDEKAALAIKALFGTGFFNDVKLESDNGVLVVIVDERPAIGVLEFSGVKEFDKEQLKKALTDNGLAEGRIFDRSTLDRAEQELKRQYLTRGLFNVQLTTTVTPLERNRVAVTIAVVEGEATKIAQLRIIGNKAFSESTLVDQFNLTTPTWFSWYTKTDQYAKEKLNGDLETLRSFYLDRGYFDFSIDSSQVSISPDRTGVFINVAITEGELYTLGDIRFAGDTLGREAQLRELLQLKTGDAYSGKKVGETLKRMNDYLGELGYAFASVQPIPVTDREKRVVAFNFLVDPGRRAYVRRINIGGNLRTRDEVIRRELRQFESSWYDSERIRLSRERVERLGFFKEVQLETRAVAGSPDQVDLQLTVVEKPANVLNFGIGTSSVDKVSISFGITQDNFMGTGRTVNLRVNSSKANRNIGISYFEPYFTDLGVSRGFDASYSRLDAARLGLGNYQQNTAALGMRFGLPLSELDRISGGLTFERLKLLYDSTSPRRIQQTGDQFGSIPVGTQRSSNSSALVLGLNWSRDNRDNPVIPSRGRLQSLSFDWGLPSQKQRYIRTSYVDQWYLPLSKDYTLGLYADISYGRGIGGRPFPVLKNLYAGGIGSVRGFDSNTLGPRDLVINPADPTGPLIAAGDPTGAPIRVQGSAEFLFALPGTGNDRTVRAFFFLDGGNVFDKFKASEIRYSAGFGLSWQAQAFPMKLSYGLPLKKDPTDKLQRFQFQVGTSF
jgi:outer membrane protein insertion porin family